MTILNKDMNTVWCRL